MSSGNGFTNNFSRFCKGESDENVQYYAQRLRDTLRLDWGIYRYRHGLEQTESHQESLKTIWNSRGPTRSILPTRVAHIFKSPVCVERTGLIVVAHDNKIAILNPYLPLTTSFDNKDFLLSATLQIVHQTSW